MPKITVRDIETNYREEGSGFPLILIHGLSDDSTLWTPLVPELSKHYKTIAVDIRGHGCSSKPDNAYSIKLFSEDLSGFMEKQEISQTHLMGLSMGGAVAQQFALDQPDKVRSLILLSAFSHSDPGLRDTMMQLRDSIEIGGLSAFFGEAVKWVVSSEFTSVNADAIAEMKVRSVQINSPEVVLRTIDACLDFNVKDKISQIRAPTLIISGREDALTPLHLAEEIHRSIRGSQWKILEGAGHNFFIPKKIPELTELILEFLEHL
jgi:3-oxoadipate enol-lactonase